MQWRGREDVGPGGLTVATANNQSQHILTTTETTIRTY